MADALGVAQVDGFADVEAKAIWRDEAGGEFARVERDVDLGVDGVEVVEHEHLAVVLGHGHVGVFGLDVVDADYVGVYRGKFEVEDGLGEDLLGREGAEDLGEEADLDGAGGGGGGLATVLELVAAREGVVQLFAGIGEVGAEFGGAEELVAKVSELGGCGVAMGADGDFWPAELVAKFGGGREGRSLHDFEILAVLGGGAGSDLVKPLGDVRLVDVGEAGEGGEELVVAAGAGGGNEGSHGEGVDEGVVEFLVLEGVGSADVAFSADGLGRDAAGGGLRLEEAESGLIDAEVVGGALGDQGFGVDGSAEVHVEVGALGHVCEEGVERERAGGFGGVEGTGGAGFLRGRGLGREDGSDAKEQDCGTVAAHGLPSDLRSEGQNIAGPVTRREGDEGGMAVESAQHSLFSAVTGGAAAGASVADENNTAVLPAIARKARAARDNCDFQQTEKT
ncbi:MAG: hypothetical protein QOE55_3509 [Acidobacteriaceae bacterium]|nr:hypothetical protein [Acidobacteriaceae bacterium]